MEKHLNVHRSKEKLKQICNPESFQAIFITCSSLFRRVHKTKATLESVGRELLLGEALLLFKGGKANNPHQIYVLLHKIKTIYIATSRAQY